MLARTKTLLAATALGCAALLTASSFDLGQRDDSTSFDSVRSVTSAIADVLQHEQVAGVARNSSAPDVVRTTLLDPSVAAVDDGSIASDEIEVALPGLRSSMLATLDGSLDPGALLDAAFLLTSRLTPALRPIPEADPSGAIRYPLNGIPEGLNALLCVRRSSNPEFSNPVLALKIELEPESDRPVRGAVRSGSELTITAYFDDRGEPKYFNVFTAFDISPANARAGVDLEHGLIPVTLLYNLDVQNPSKWTAEATRIHDGRFESSSIPLTLVGGPWPRMDDIVRFGEQLERMYDYVKQE